MNVNSSSSYSVSGSLTATNSNAITGLASGLDTDSIVEEMLSGIKSKIESKEAEKQQAEWKQEMYRDVISAINDFSSTYLDSAYDADTENNLASEDFFDTMISTSSSSAVSIVSSSSDASEGEMTIEVSQLAEAASLTGVDMADGYTITGSALTSDDLQQLKRTLALDVTVSGATTNVEVDLSDVASSSDLVSAINSAFSSAGVSGYFTASAEDGYLVLTGSDSSYSISVNKSNSTTAGLAVSGMSSTTTGEDDDTGGATLTGSASIDATEGLTITVDLDGVEKEITIVPTTDTNGDITEETLAADMNAALQTAFGTAITASFTDDGELELTLSDAYQAESGHELAIYGSDASYFGITPGATTAFDTSQTLAEMGLTGSTFEFSINGVDFSFDSDTKVSKVISEINSSDAGVTLSYSSFSDQFTLEADSTGSAYSMEIEETTGDFLSTIFGSGLTVASSSIVSEGTLTTASATGSAYNSSYTASSFSTTITVDGTAYTVSLSDTGSTYDADTMVSAINDWFESEFGTDTNGDAYISYDATTGTLSVTNGSVVSFATDDTGTGIETELGFTGLTNTAGDTTTLGDIVELADFVTAMSAAGTDVSGYTLAEVAAGSAAITVGGATLGYSNGALTLTNDTASDVTVDLASYGLADMFGAEEVTLGVIGATQTIAGQDAKVTINGITTSRSSNTFTIDGVTMTVNDLTDGEETISTARDIDTIVEGITAFVESYNEMLTKLYEYVDSDKTYLDYDPLTSDQEEEMTETQIENWNEKAQEGLLHRDTTIDSFLGACRSLMYTKPDSSSFALYQIGIETGDYKEKGLLYIDEDALREALSSDPESVKNLFTDSKSGIATTLEDICNDYAKDSYGSTGLLVLEAGIDGGAYDSTNNLSLEISDLEDKIDELQDRYEARRDTLWEKMSSLETALSSYNSTATYLSSMFSS